MDRYLITGLGNPGAKYENTRHNVGFRVVKALASKYALTLKPALIRAKGSLGKGMIKERDVLLLLPLTYMNESGRSVQRCAKYYKVPTENVMVIADDTALPFGKLRMRGQGGCGGHNGLKSIEAHLGTQDYARLRIGIGEHKGDCLVGFVLDPFTRKEQEALIDVVDESVHAIELWLEGGIEQAMQEVNT